MANWKLWQAATESYERKAKQKQAAQQLTPKPIRAEEKPNLDQLYSELSNFIQSEEGKAAMRMLSASKRHIVFGEEYEGGGTSVVYYIDGTGLHESVEQTGMWLAYASSSEKKPPSIRSATVKECIDAAVNPRMGGKRPYQVMSWLYGELDKIANSAP